MNDSLGYKLRKHIAKALESRSQAIRTALSKYNNAAASLNPPAPQLTWEKVVEYTVLAEFDLLRDTRQDVRQKPWAISQNRVLRDEWFKMERAREEVERLNIEVRRLITYIRDENQFLRERESAVEVSDPPLAHQIMLYRLERARFNSFHKQQLLKLANIPEFTGDMNPGNPRIAQPAFDNAPGTLQHANDDSDGLPNPDPDEEEEEDDDVPAEIAFALLTVSTDRSIVSASYPLVGDYSNCS